MTLAFVFPGQGSQTVGMGGDWLGRSAEVARTFEEADDALGQKLSEVILRGPEDALTRTENTQPALLCVSVAYARVLAAEGVTPDAVAGHSLGEYSALVAAGGLAFDAAVRLTRLRGQAMQSAVPLGVGTMAAVLGIKDVAVVEALCAACAGGEVLEPAGFNTLGQVVVAGHVGAVRRAVDRAREFGGMAKELSVSAPFHCSLLVPAGARLAEALADVAFRAPSVPYVPNVDASWQDAPSPASMKQALVDQVSQPVRWLQTMETMAAHGVDRWLEVGAGRTLVGLIKKWNRGVAVDAFEAEGWRS